MSWPGRQADREGGGLAGWLGVNASGLGSSLGLVLLAWLSAVVCIALVQVRMYTYGGLGWGRDGDDGLRIWAEQVEGLGQDRIGQNERTSQAWAAPLARFSSG